MSEEIRPYLYLLTEDDNDDIFFERCAERITGKSFYKISNRLRKNGGIGEVRKKLKLFLNSIKHSQGMEAYFIIALDCDRAPEHYSDSDNQLIHNKITGLSKTDSNKQCRYCEIEKQIKEIWGRDSNNWVAKGAIAVPVQMLESWILIGLNPSCTKDLPIFAEKKQASAKNYYKKNYNNSPSDQLKDLCDQFRYKQEVINKAEFFLDIADTMDLNAVTAASSSFAQFRNQVASW